MNGREAGARMWDARPWRLALRQLSSEGDKGVQAPGFVLKDEFILQRLTQPVQESAPKHGFVSP